MNFRYIDEFEKNNELVRTKTNSCGVSSYRVRCVRCYFFSYQGTEKSDNALRSLCTLWLIIMSLICPFRFTTQVLLMFMFCPL
jgi:hypothetical protein